MITITTVLKTGKMYNSTWVNKMKAALERHVSIPFKFVPLTDSYNYGMDHSLVQENPGYWNKIELFRPGLFEGQTLYIDLDNVIIGDLAPIITFLNSQDSFVMYKSRTTKKQQVPAPSSCVMYWKSPPTYLWDIWNSIEDKSVWYKRYSSGRLGDQAFIRDHLHDFKLLQEIYPPASNQIKFVKGAEPDLSGVSMLVFAGNRKPHTCNWNVVKENWHNA